MLFGCSVIAVSMVIGTSSASAAFHGIAVSKGCTSPVEIGDPYTCAVQIKNIVDTGHDTLRVTGLSDVVHSAGGDVATGNILASTGLIFTGAVSCSGGSGTGTPGDPYLGATECLLPFGTEIQTATFSHYTVQAADFNLPNNRLTDTASVAWNNTCTFDPDLDCTTGGQNATAGSSALITKLGSSTVTAIHNAQHQVVTAVQTGTTVHDFVTVTGQPNNPTPSGNVNIDWFLNGTCTGAPAANSGSIGPLSAGQFDATGFSFTVNTAGMRAFKAHYEGDALYAASDGACEPLSVSAPTANPFTPGYWKNHQVQTTALLPITLGNYAVNTFPKVTDVFGGMNCGASKPQGAAGCLAGHLLAAKLNVANGASTCIAPKIVLGDAFLIAIGYTGPTGTYVLTAAQRDQAIAIKDALDKYNNGLVC